MVESHSKNTFHHLRHALTDQVVKVAASKSGQQVGVEKWGISILKTSEMVDLNRNEATDCDGLDPSYPTVVASLLNQNMEVKTIVVQCRMPYLSPVASLQPLQCAQVCWLFWAEPRKIT